jgi:hypothetical protein
VLLLQGNRNRRRQMKTWRAVVDGRMVVMTLPQLRERIQRPQHSRGLLYHQQQPSLSQQALR